MAKHSNITELVIKAFYRVYNTLGYGFLEKVYRKATQDLAEEHEAQLLNYLKCTRFEVGLLLNFGTEAQIKRKTLDNSRKGDLSWTKHP